MSVSITRSINNEGEVSAGFESYDSNTGILTDVIVTANYVSTTINGKTSYSATLSDSVSISNQIGGYFITVGEATGPATLVTIDPTLQTAHVVGAVQIVDFNSIAYYPVVNLYWHADSGLQTQTNKTITYEGAGTTVVEKMTGLGRDAVATGTVSLPATSEFPAMANIVPEASYQAGISKINDGTLTITVALPPKINKLLSPFSGTTITLDGSDLLQQLTGM